MLIGGLILLNAMAQADLKTELLKTVTEDFKKSEFSSTCNWMNAASLKTENKKYFQKNMLELKSEKMEGFCHSSISRSGKPQKLDLPELYTFFEDAFTMYSIEDINQINKIQEIPSEIKKFVSVELKKRKGKEINEQDLQPVVVEGLELTKKFPELSKAKLTVVSLNKSINTSIKSLRISLHVESGNYQIELIPKEVLKDSVLAYIEKNNEPVKLPERSQVPHLSFLQKSQKDMTVIALDKSSPFVFIGTNQNTSSSMEMIWNKDKNEIEQLKVVSGNSLGNESLNFSLNIPLEFKGKTFLLRKADRFSEIITFQNGYLFKKVIANHLSPEV